MVAPRQQRMLLQSREFLAHLDEAVRNLNGRYATNLVLDKNCALRAHAASKIELEVLLDSKREDVLFEAFDTFVDLLVENLIKERAFVHLINPANVDLSDRIKTIRDLIQRYGEILTPIMLMDNWLRSLVFHLTGHAIPSYFDERNAEAVHALCLSIKASNEQARHWRHMIGYPPL